MSAHARAVQRTGLYLVMGKTSGQSKASSSSSTMVRFRSFNHACVASGGFVTRFSRTSRKTQGETTSAHPWARARSKMSREPPVRERHAARATLLSIKRLTVPAGSVLRRLHPRRASRRVPLPSRCGALPQSALGANGLRGNGGVPPSPHWAIRLRPLRFHSACSCAENARCSTARQLTGLGDKENVIEH